MDINFRKRKYIIIVGIFLCILVVFTFYLISKKSEDLTTGNEVKFSLSDLQWGLFNNGQRIRNSIGLKGIDINVLPAWNLTKGSKNVIIGILDTGIDIKNNAIKNSIFINKHEIADNGIDDDNNGYVDDINGWDFANNDNSVYDSEELDLHGTAITGIIASDFRESKVVGVCPNTKVLPLKFLSGDKGNVRDAIKAIEYAKQQGVKIMNCSWGIRKSNSELEEAIKNSGMLFICSSGNKGDPSKVYPAQYNLPNIISVTAIDNKGDISIVANKESVADVAAPGTDILTISTQNDTTYQSGTSMAVPFVTGIAALISSYNENCSVEDISLSIKTNVKKCSSLKGIVSSEGIVDAYKCLKYLTVNYCK